VGGLVKCLMERRFSEEAKSFSFFGDFGQIGVLFGGKEKRIWWVYFVGEQGLSLASRHGGRGALVSEEG
jgi:hypothetical protein